MHYVNDQLQRGQQMRGRQVNGALDMLMSRELVSRATSSERLCNASCYCCRLNANRNLVNDPRVSI